MTSLASLRLEIVERLQAWSRAETERAAALLSRDALTSTAAAVSEQLDTAFAEARSAAAALQANTASAAQADAIHAAWRRLEQVFTDDLDPSPRLAALASFAGLLLDTVEGQPDLEPGREVYENGDLTLGDLRNALDQAIAETDWDEAERLVGQPIPPEVRAAPLDVTTLRDGFNGATALQVLYAPWASRLLRAGLTQLMTRRWLPALRSQRGENALGAAAAETDPATETLCTIHFGTNRVVRDGQFTADCEPGPNSLQFGLAQVSVPVCRRRGNVPRPWQVLGQGPRAVRGRHMVITDQPRLIDHASFVASLKSGSTAGAAFLFVHGYNTPFDAGFWRTAQLAVDLEVDGPVLHYAWPSAGNPIAYELDGKNIEASREPFKAFIRTLLEDDLVPQLNIVVHSKGGELVLDALAALAAETPGRARAQHLVLASPDVDRVVADGLLRSVPKFFSSVTLYANAHDRPLTLSAGLALRERIGGVLADHHPFIAADVDTIDAANTDFGWFGLNHNAYIDAPVLMYDLGALLKRGVRPPDQRSPVIRPKDCPRGRYYQVVTA